MTYDWNEVRPVIHQKIVVEGLNHNEVLEFLKEEPYNFNPGRVKMTIFPSFSNRDVQHYSVAQFIILTLRSQPSSISKKTEPMGHHETRILF